MMLSSPLLAEAGIEFRQSPNIINPRNFPSITSVLFIIIEKEVNVGKVKKII